MTAEKILDAIGMVNDEAVREARSGREVELDRRAGGDKRAEFGRRAGCDERAEFGRETGFDGETELGRRAGFDKGNELGRKAGFGGKTGFDRKTGFGRVARWGSLAACLGAILTVTAVTWSGFPGGQGESMFPGSSGGQGEPTLPGHSDGQGKPVFPSDSEASGSAAREDGGQTMTSAVEPSPSSGEQEILIHWDKVAVNESAGLGMDAARRYYDPELYLTENWGEEEVTAYYGWDLVPGYIPSGLTDGGNGAGGFVCKEKATGKILEDQGGRSFWVDFWEDGSPKSDDDIVIPKGFSVSVSKTGILHCALLPVDEERTTDFGGVSVTLTHCSMKHGPFDPTQKAPDGLSNMPAGYYDVYVASFVLDGTEYEIEAHRLELEEVIQIVASVINVPYREDFIVGDS